MVVTSGGVSVGEKDLVKSTMLDLGVEQVFWGVKFKPGKPLFYGTRGETRLFGLPGNPVSAMVCFDLFVRPALMRMMGRKDKNRPRIRSTSSEQIVNKFGRLHAMRVSLERTEKGWLAESVGAQGSGLVSSLTKADALALIGPASDGIPPGEPIEAIVLRQEKLRRQVRVLRRAECSRWSAEGVRDAPQGCGSSDKWRCEQGQRATSAVGCDTEGTESVAEGLG